MEDLFYITIRKEPTAALLDAIENVPRKYRLRKDRSIADEFPEQAQLSMLPEYGMELRDFINNQSDLVVVSERVKTFLEAQDDVDNVEMLPVSILDHKGRVVEEPFYVVHLMQHQDCIDQEASEAKVRASRKDMIASVKRLVLKEDCVDPDVALFRLSRYPYPVLVRRSLVERLEAEGFAGVAFNPLSEFDHFAIL